MIFFHSPEVQTIFWVVFDEFITVTLVIVG